MLPHVVKRFLAIAAAASAASGKSKDEDASLGANIAFQTYDLISRLSRPLIASFGCCCFMFSLA
jgi:hypothetical protein